MKNEEDPAPRYIMGTTVPEEFIIQNSSLRHLKMPTLTPLLPLRFRNHPRFWGGGDQKPYINQV